MTKNLPRPSSFHSESRARRRCRRGRQRASPPASAPLRRTKKAVPSSEKTGLWGHQGQSTELSYLGFACLKLFSTHTGRDNICEARVRSLDPPVVHATHRDTVLSKRLLHHPHISENHLILQTLHSTGLFSWKLSQNSICDLILLSSFHRLIIQTQNLTQSQWLHRYINQYKTKLTSPEIYAQDKREQTWRKPTEPRLVRRDVHKPGKTVGTDS